MNRRGLVDEVVEALRSAILSGHLRPGQWLVESAIARQMQVSRGPLREALRLLQQEGLVTTVPNKGTHVTRLTEEDVRELHTLRALLEGFAVGKLCREGDVASTSAQLRRLVADMAASARADDMAAFSRLDFAFHETIVAGSAMPRLYGLWKSLNGLLSIWLLSVQQAVRQCAPAVVEEHESITVAIELRKADEAERLLRQHILERGKQVLRLALELESGSGTPTLDA